MQKERNIVEGKYPKNCWNKIILMLGINLLFVKQVRGMKICLLILLGKVLLLQ